MENRNVETNNSVIVILLVVLIGVVAGVGLLIGITNAVKVAVGPLDMRLAAIERQEKDIQSKVNNLDNLKDIQADVDQVKTILNSVTTHQAAPAPSYPQEDMNKVYNIPVGISPVLGDKNAPVTITEFTDLQCPFCAHFYQPVVKDVLAAYPGKVRVVIKNFPLPFHPNARPAAKLALAAQEQGKFQPMMEALLANGGDVSDASIKKYAQDLGLNYNQLMADYKNRDAEWEKRITDDIQLAGNVDVQGTPTFYLNGKKTNSRDINSLKAEIDPLLKNS